MDRKGGGVILFDANDVRWSGVSNSNDRGSIMLDLSYVYDTVGVGSNRSTDSALTSITRRSVDGTIHKLSIDSMGRPSRDEIYRPSNNDICRPTAISISKSYDTQDSSAHTSSSSYELDRWTISQRRASSSVQKPKKWYSPAKQIIKSIFRHENKQKHENVH
ncbi:hypothetical protein THRCLA_20890 [Thraustotheca clavata]|uniref:Uncharacterized protein n=1 Tax=Thraustotheca clavata TaxID=74557 RepID=A0A1W0A2Z1_9STRA|nr:hypothetical protein THRCLA_20890 [Thraustotheca clavata]